MKTQDLKWLAYARSFTSDVRHSREGRTELYWTVFGAAVVFAAIWKLIS